MSWGKTFFLRDSKFPIVQFRSEQISTFALFNGHEGNVKQHVITYTISV